MDYRDCNHLLTIIMRIKARFRQMAARQFLWMATISPGSKFYNNLECCQSCGGENQIFIFFRILSILWIFY